MAGFWRTFPDGSKTYVDIGGQSAPSSGIPSSSPSYDSYPSQNTSPNSSSTQTSTTTSTTITPPQIVQPRTQQSQVQSPQQYPQTIPTVFGLPQPPTILSYQSAQPNTLPSPVNPNSNYQNTQQAQSVNLPPRSVNPVLGYQNSGTNVSPTPAMPVSAQPKPQPLPIVAGTLPVGGQPAPFKTTILEKIKAVFKNPDMPIVKTNQEQIYRNQYGQIQGGTDINPTVPYTAPGKTLSPYEAKVVADVKSGLPIEMAGKPTEVKLRMVTDAVQREAQSKYDETVQGNTVLSMMYTQELQNKVNRGEISVEQARDSQDRYTSMLNSNVEKRREEIFNQAEYEIRQRQSDILNRAVLGEQINEQTTVGERAENVGTAAIVTGTSVIPVEGQLALGSALIAGGAAKNSDRAVETGLLIAGTGVTGLVSEVIPVALRSGRQLTREEFMAGASRLEKDYYASALRDLNNQKFKLAGQEIFNTPEGSYNLIKAERSAGGAKQSIEFDMPTFRTGKPPVYAEKEGKFVDILDTNTGEKRQVFIPGEKTLIEKGTTGQSFLIKKGESVTKVYDPGSGAIIEYRTPLSGGGRIPSISQGAVLGKLNAQRMGMEDENLIGGAGSFYLKNPDGGFKTGKFVGVSKETEEGYNIAGGRATSTRIGEDGNTVKGKINQYGQIEKKPIVQESSGSSIVMPTRKAKTPKTDITGLGQQKTVQEDAFPMDILDAPKSEPPLAAPAVVEEAMESTIPKSGPSIWEGTGLYELTAQSTGLARTINTQESQQEKFINLESNSGYNPSPLGIRTNELDINVDKIGAASIPSISDIQSPSQTISQRSLQLQKESTVQVNDIFNIPQIAIPQLDIGVPGFPTGGGTLTGGFSESQGSSRIKKKRGRKPKYTADVAAAFLGTKIKAPKNIKPMLDAKEFTGLEPRPLIDLK